MVSPYMYTFLNVHINYIPISDRVCEGSGGSCIGMRSINGAWEVSGKTVSLVGVVSGIQLYNFIYKYSISSYSQN